METPDTQRNSISPAQCSARFVNDWEIEDSCTGKLSTLHRACKGNYHIEIGFGLRNTDRSCAAQGVTSQIGICDYVSIRNVIRIPIVLCVSFNRI